MVSSITQDPYSIIISLNLASFVNLNIGAPPRSTELLVLLLPHGTDRGLTLVRASYVSLDANCLPL